MSRIMSLLKRMKPPQLSEIAEGVEETLDGFASLRRKIFRGASDKIVDEFDDKINSLRKKAELFKKKLGFRSYKAAGALAMGAEMLLGVVDLGFFLSSWKTGSVKIHKFLQLSIKEFETSLDEAYEWLNIIEDIEADDPDKVYIMMYKYHDLDKLTKYLQRLERQLRDFRSDIVKSEFHILYEGVNNRIYEPTGEIEVLLVKSLAMIKKGKMFSSDFLREELIPTYEDVLDYIEEYMEDTSGNMGFEPYAVVDDRVQLLIKD